MSKVALERVGRVLAIAGTVVWLFAVSFAYYVVHKPFTVENAAALLNTAGDLLVALTLAVVAASIGLRLSRSIEFGSALETLVFSAGLGLGVISLATLGLGVAGVLNRFLFWALLLLAGLVLRGEMRETIRTLRRVELPVESRFERALAVFVALALGMALLLALAPPIAWDAQTYHLVEGKTALALGRIAPPPDIPYFNFPSLVEMLFLAAMALKGDSAAQVMHWQFLLLTVAALFSLSRRFFSSRVGWLACAFLAGVPSLLTLATYAYVDLALVFYAFTACYALMVSRERQDGRWIALAGVCAGLALGVKYTAAIVPLALLVVLLLSPALRHPRFVASLLGCAALVAAPWYLRNLVFTGNPVYPFVLGGPFWDAFRADWFSRFGTGLLHSPLGLVTAPWDATVLGREGGLTYEATIGPLLLALVPLLLVVRPRKDVMEDPMREPLVFAAIIYLFWLSGVAGSKLLVQTRLLFPIFPLLALLAAVALERLAQLDLPQFSVHRFARLVIAVVLGLTGLSYGLGFVAGGDLAYLVGAETREAYLARTLGPYAAAVNYVNTNLPVDARVLTLWEPRSYYVGRPVQPDAILDLLPHLSWKYKTPEAVAATLQNAGFTHILFNRQGFNLLYSAGYDPISAQDVEVLSGLLSDHAQLIYGSAFEFAEGQVVAADQSPYALYRLDAR